MDTNTATEGEYFARLTERERDIYSRGHNTGLLARGRINFGPIPLFDPRTHRGADAATDGYIDADCDHDNIRCTHVDACTELTETRTVRSRRQSALKSHGLYNSLGICQPNGPKTLSRHPGRDDLRRVHERSA